MFFKNQEANLSTPAKKSEQQKVAHFFWASKEIREI